MFECNKINEDRAVGFECFEFRRSALMFQHRGNV